jgi:ubiquitin-protein ligase
MYLFDNGMFDALYTVNNKSLKSIEMDADNDIAKLVITLYQIVAQLYSDYNIHKENIDFNPKEYISVSTSQENIYIQTMHKHKCNTCSILDNGYYSKYRIKATNQPSNMNNCFRRLSGELPTLTELLPINKNVTVLMSIHGDIKTGNMQPNILRFLITGPIDTPYNSGIFMFDAYMSSDYPNTSPEFHMINTGGYRFNPNLYACGKVCLSLLGTYVGPIPDSSEKWIPNISTLAQVIVSIQSQIMVDNPYFNEPGRESSYGTIAGMNRSKIENRLIQTATMKIAMLDMIKYSNKYPQFTNAIRDYFRLKRDDILKTCKQWNDDIVANGNCTVFDELCEELNKL